MLYAIRARREGRRLARKVCRSLATEIHEWKVEATPGNRFEVRLNRANGNVVVLIMPLERRWLRWLRSSEQVRLLVDGVDLFVPLVPRIRLRGAARLRALWNAEQKLEKYW